MAQECDENLVIYEVVKETIKIHLRNVAIITLLIRKRRARNRKRSLNDRESYSMISRFPTQISHMRRMVGTTNADCMNNLRMDRNTFGRLCLLLREIGGLKDGKYVSVEEQVALLLCVLAHHKKNRIVGFDFLRSGETISRYIHIVMKSILKLHGLFLVKPEPVLDDCQDSRWKWFKGCLGALDGTYINVKVPNSDKPRFRTRKGQISTNTLAVCDRELRFVYVLPGWEGSAADSRILRDAVNRPHGLKVPKGYYYLCDNGYANSDGFLTPFKGVRYHLKEWGPNAVTPENPEEMFNMRHTKARNVIERAFGIMKMRWGILRSASFYPVKSQVRLIMTCFLLHNFIRNEMRDDPIEHALDDDLQPEPNEAEIDDEMEYVESIEASTAWTQKRLEIANEMWNAYNV